MTVVIVHVTDFLHMTNLKVLKKPTSFAARTLEQFAVVFEETPEKVQRLWSDKSLALQDASALANAYNRKACIRPVTITLHELELK